MNILLIDDDKLVCSSLEIILSADSEVKVVGKGHSGKEGIELYEKYQPDILLMDIRMENMTGLDAGEIILEKHPDAKILYLTTFLDDDYIIKALKIGAKGYILKQDFECILPSLKAVYAGQNIYGTEIVTKLPNLLNAATEKKSFSEFGINPKEYDIIEQISEGLSNKEIADALYLSEGTVRNYISLILEKLQLRDRTQIAIFYYKNI